MTEALFAVIEGLDGVGKTTVTDVLASILVQHLGVRQVVKTHEPHENSAMGNEIRQVLRKELIMSPRMLELAFALNRQDHVDNLINPFAKARPDGIIICDRYYPSSMVYQGTSSTLGEILDLNKGARKPDMIFYLQAHAEVCAERMDKRGALAELFEDNFAKYSDKYDEVLQYLSRIGHNIIYIDANQEPASVVQQIMNYLIGVNS